MEPEIPLKEQKQARSRLALLQSLVTRLQSQEFAEIKIKDLCKDALVSEATFYNYFPKKTDLLYYFIQLWTLNVTHAARTSGKKTAFEKLLVIFEKTARESSENPRIMSEIIAAQANLSGPTEKVTLSVADRVFAYPDIPEMLEYPDQGLDSILAALITEAKESGELPPSADAELVMLGLSSLFLGIPMFLSGRAPADVMIHSFQKELEIYWTGAGGKLPEHSDRKKNSISKKSREKGKTVHRKPRRSKNEK